MVVVFARFERVAVPKLQRGQRHIDITGQLQHREVDLGRHSDHLRLPSAEVVREYDLHGRVDRVHDQVCRRDEEYLRSDLEGDGSACTHGDDGWRRLLDSFRHERSLRL